MSLFPASPAVVAHVNVCLFRLSPTPSLTDVVFELSLRHPAGSAYLQQRIHGRPVAPVSVLLSMAAAASSCLASSVTAAPLEVAPALSNIVFAPPCSLSQLLDEGGGVLKLTLQPTAGLLEVGADLQGAQVPGQARYQVLMQAAMALLPLPMAALQSASSASITPASVAWLADARRPLAASVARKQVAATEVAVGPFARPVAVGLEVDEGKGSVVLRVAVVDPGDQPVADRWFAVNQPQLHLGDGQTDGAEAALQLEVLRRTATSDAPGKAVLGVSQAAYFLAGSQPDWQWPAPGSSGQQTAVSCRLERLQLSEWAADRSASNLGGPLSLRSLTQGGRGGSTLQAGPGVDAMSISTLVQGLVEAAVGGAVEPDQPLMAAGLDSIAAMELRNSLQVRVGV